MKNILILLSAASIVFACANPSANKQAQQMAFQKMTPQVEVVSAQYQDVEQSEIYSSTVLAWATNNIAPQGSNRIQKIFVEIGDFVKAGQVLAQMDMIQLEQAQLKYVNDSTELQRLKSLYQEGGLSQSDYESAEMACKVSRSTYLNLQENTILRSPVTGVVTARNYDRGDMYSMSQPIFTVQQITPVKLLVAVSESDYSKVNKGDKVSLTVDAIPGKTFYGAVERIYPTMDAASHTFNAEIKVDNNFKTLRPGMYAKVKLNFGSNHSIVIPDIAVTKQQGSGQRIVFVLEEGNVAVQKFVTLGRHFDKSYEILSGLSEGDKVIFKGQSSLLGGETVEVK